MKGLLPAVIVGGLTAWMLAWAQKPKPRDFPIGQPNGQPNGQPIGVPPPDPTQTQTQPVPEFQAGDTIVLDATRIRKTLLYPNGLAVTLPWALAIVEFADPAAPYEVYGTITHVLTEAPTPGAVLPDAIAIQPIRSDVAKSSILLRRRATGGAFEPFLYTGPERPLGPINPDNQSGGPFRGGGVS